MADIVLAIGTSHSPLLNSPAEDYPKHAAIDASGRKLLDKRGRPCTYGELLERADLSIKDQITPQVLEQRSARCTANIEKLSRVLADARLNSVIIVGDDQHEQFFDDNMPAILIYWGDKIKNNPLNMDDDVPQFWRKARSQFHEVEQSREYPVDSRLGLHLIERLIRAGFRRQPIPASHQGAWRRSCLRLRASPNNDRPRYSDRTCGAQHLLSAKPTVPATLLRAGQGDSRRSKFGQGQRADRHSRFGRLEPFHDRRGTRLWRARRL